eukprot:4479778-Alexandrium_andersonii.AAC.1
MGYRGVSIMSIVYRTFGKLVLRALKGWQKGWASHHLFAVVPGRSAQDAWYGGLGQSRAGQTQKG